MNNLTDKKFQSDTVTQGIRIQAESFYLNTSNDARREVNTFSYKINITNEGNQTCQLVSRHWIIIDSDGERDEVKGPGVVGATPRLEPGQSFSYTSYSQIESSWGTMEGSFLFTREGGEDFRAEISRFFLISNA